MKSSRPYVVNALIDWICDNGCTPHIVIDIRCDGVEGPTEFADDNLLVLNVSASAVRNFTCDAEGLKLDARFSGQSRHVTSPTGAIVGVFAKENGQGMSFQPEVETGSTYLTKDTSGKDAQTTEPKLPSYLRIVKD